jgi:chitin synthase
MYNESDELFVKSLLAVQKNIAYLCSDRCPYSWGRDGWKEFVICIVSDGVQKLNPRVEAILGTYGMWLGKDFRYITI